MGRSKALQAAAGMCRAQFTGSLRVAGKKKKLMKEALHFLNLMKKKNPKTQIKKPRKS